MRKTKKFTKSQAEAAKSLAVCYEAYLDAKRLGDKGAAKCWQSMLASAQERTGVKILELN